MPFSLWSYIWPESLIASSPYLTTYSTISRLSKMTLEVMRLNICSDWDFAQQPFMQKQFTGDIAGGVRVASRRRRRMIMGHPYFFHCCTCLSLTSSRLSDSAILPSLPPIHKTVAFSDLFILTCFSVRHCKVCSDCFYLCCFILITNHLTEF